MNIILHVLYPINNYTMVRNILSPTTVFTDAEYHCVLPTQYMSILIKKFYFDYYKNVIFHFVKNGTDVTKIISTLNPKAILLSNSPSSKLTYSTTIPHYYIHHGIFNHSRGGEYSKKIGGWKNLPITKYICGDDFANSFYTKKKFNHIKIPGLPQFDLILESKEKYPDIKETFKKIHKINDDKLIVLTVGSHNYAYDTAVYKKIIQAVDTIKPDSHFIFKAKFANIIKSGLKNNVTHSNFKQLIQEYLFADIIIVHTYGTSFIEGLIANPRTILIDKNYKNTYNAPLVYKNVTEVSQDLEKIINDPYYKSEEFVLKVKEYLNKILGGPLEKVSNLIIDSLANDKWVEEDKLEDKLEETN